MHINRYLEHLINSRLYKGKSIFVLGARRAGKTSLCHLILNDNEGAYYNCELQETKDLLSTQSKTALKYLVNNHKIVVFDEAQVIRDFGQKLKILHDSFPATQIIVTGSSSFDLVNISSEPMTGRSRMFKMFPLSFQEILDHFGIIEATGQLERLLIYGAYPEVYLYDKEEKIEELENIASNYLYKDVLNYGGLKKPELLLDLLRLLAFQLGNEVSLNELSNKLNTTVATIKNYLYHLEKSYVIITIGGYSKNLRKEIEKSKKYYFYDLGIRNSIIKNFNHLQLRNDIGPLWENFCIIERIKRNESKREFKNYYFWRTYDGQEIDFLEEFNGELHGYEFKYSKNKMKVPKIFIDTYVGSSISLVNKDNFMDFVI